MNDPASVLPSLEIEASNLLCVPVEAWPLVERYALMVVARCRAKERMLHANGRSDDAKVIRDLLNKLQAKVGVRGPVAA